jgi:flagellar hook assembly protein FlgD
MNPVRTVIQNTTRNSPDELFTIWDGRNDNGITVANGVYFYRIEVDDDKDVWGKILVLQ